MCHLKPASGIHTNGLWLLYVQDAQRHHAGCESWQMLRLPSALQAYRVARSECLGKAMSKQV